MSDPQLRKLARQIHRLSRTTRGQARGSQAAYRSVEVTDGPVSHYDEDGVPRLVVGPQPDGTFTIIENNPGAPPQPTDPTVIDRLGGVEIVWDGTYATENTPIDYKHCEVHASEVPNFEKTDATQVHAFTSVNGGSYFFACEPQVTWYFALVVVNRSDLESLPSQEVPGAGIPPDVPLSDGNPPATAPVVTGVGGVKAAFLRWDPVANPDPVRYEVHQAGVLVGETSGTFFSIALDPGDYNFEVFAKDADGIGPSSGVTTISVIQAVDPAEVAAHDAAITQLQTDLDTAEVTISDHTASINQLNLDMDSADTTLANHNTLINQLQVDLDADEVTIANHTTSINTLNTDLATAQTDIDNLQAFDAGVFPIVETDIQDGAITTPKMTANSINGDRIAANTLNATKIVAGSITTDRMTANSISGDRIAANTLDAAKIVAGSITTDRMTANSISGDRIAANTLDAAKIVAGSITTDRMTANSISGDRIAANTLDAAKIVAGSITTDRMTANTISGDRIAGNTLDATKIIATSITARELHSEAVTADKIKAGEVWVGTVNADQINGGELLADVALVGKIEAKGVGLVGLSGDEGFYVKGPEVNGVRQPLVTFPTDGGVNVITSQLTATTATFEQGASFGGASAIQIGAKIVLNGDIKAPKNAPTLIQEYPSVPMVKPTSHKRYYGFSKGHNGNYFAAYATGSSGAHNNIVEWNPATGAVVSYKQVYSFVSGLSSYDIRSFHYNTVRGKYYALVWDAAASQYHITVFDTGWSRIQTKNGVRYALAGTPAIGFDAVTGDILLASYDANFGIATIERWATDANGFISAAPIDASPLQLAGTGALDNDDITYVARGTFDLSVERYIVKYRRSDRGYETFITGTGAADAAYAWPQANGQITEGAFWDTAASKFYDLSSGSAAIEYQGGISFWAGQGTSAQKKWWAKYTFYEAVGTAHETPGSPISSLVVNKRSRVVVSVDKVPTGAAGIDDPTHARIYAVQGLTSDATPSDAALQLRLTLAAATQTAVMSPGTVAGGAALTAKAIDFAAATNPGGIESNDGGSYWRGDNTAKFLALQLDSTQDATTNAGNTPALRIGPPTGQHLRIDGNEIVSMSNDSTQGNLIINSGGMVSISGYCKTGVKNSGALTANTDKVVSVVFPSAFPASAPIPTVQLQPVDIVSLANAVTAIPKNITRSGFDITLRRTSTTAFDVAWTAIAQ